MAMLVLTISTLVTHRETETERDRDRHRGREEEEEIINFYIKVKTECCNRDPNLLREQSLGLRGINCLSVLLAFRWKAV